MVLLLKDRSMGARDYFGLLIVAVICLLTFNLATRYWISAVSQAHASNQVQVTKSLQRRSFEPTRQHLDRDAAQWVAPIVNFSILKPASFGPRAASLGPRIQNPFLDANLYNRPPPSSKFVL
jgi:hypothetical protein